jgi:hypothetical protein
MLVIMGALAIVLWAKVFCLLLILADEVKQSKED